MEFCRIQESLIRINTITTKANHFPSGNQIIDQQNHKQDPENSSWNPLDFPEHFYSKQNEKDRPLTKKTRWLPYVAIMIALLSITSSQMPQANAVTFGSLTPATGTVNIPVQFNAGGLVPGPAPQARPITVFWDIGAIPGAAVDDTANNNLWNQGETVAYDTDADNNYDTGEPLVVTQTVSTPGGPVIITPDSQTHLKTDTKVMYVDNNANSVWDSGEAVVYDSDGNNQFSAGDVVITGAAPETGTSLSTDSRIKYVDGDTSCATTATGSFCSALWTFATTGTFNIKATAVDNTGLGPAARTGTIAITEPPDIFIDPPTANTIFPGSTIFVSLMLGSPTKPANDLDAWEVTLLFDQTVLTPVGVGPSGIPCGPSPACTPADYGASVPFDTYGVLRTPTLNDEPITASVIIGATFFTFPTVGPSGSGTLAQVAFTADGPGGSISSIHFQDVKLRSQASTQTVTMINAITASLITNGSASITGTLDFSPTTAPLNQAQTFTAAATGGTPPYTFNWDFDNDGTIDATGQSASFTFTSEGSFPVALSITDTASTPNTGFIIKAVTVGQPPALTVPGPQSVAEGSPLSFGVSASDPDAGQTVTIVCIQCASLGASFSSPPGNPASGTFSWTPNEGQGPKDYTFTFTATDDSPLQRSDTKAVMVHVDEVNQKPSLTVPGAKLAAVGEVLTFSVSASDPDLSATSTPLNIITITCTDCPPGTFTSTPGNPTSGTFSWTTTTADVGTHTFTFVATDDGTPQLTDTKTVDVTVIAGKPPVASFTFTPSTAAVGESVNFDGSASTDDGTITSYSWTFGDGQTGSGATITHSYANPGTYTVTLTVTDNDGLTASVTHDITIVAQLQATVSAVPSQGNTPLTVTFTAQASGGSPPYTYTWNFGDGTSGSGRTQSHTYQSQGVFQATVTVTDSQGRTAQASSAITVTSPATTTLRISVADSQGNALVGATVRLISLPPGQSNPGTKTTGADGSVILDNLLPGDYTFEASMTGFQSVSKTVTVQVGGYGNQASASLTEVARAPPAPINYTPYIIGGIAAFLIGLGLYLRSRSAVPRPKASAVR